MPPHCSIWPRTRRQAGDPDRAVNYYRLYLMYDPADSEALFRSGKLKVQMKSATPFSRDCKTSRPPVHPPPGTG